MAVTRHTKRKQLKLLLIQVRKDLVTEQEEIEAFLRHGQLEQHQLEIFNVYKTPDFPADRIHDFDGLLVGGSSDASMSNPAEIPALSTCKKILRICYEANIPVFASCFGYQIAIDEFGGKIIQDKENLEMGTQQIFLTHAAKEDELLGDFPTAFWAVCGHQDHAAKLPENAILLGYSTRSHQIIRLKNKPFYGFQFHPEINLSMAISRTKRYQSRYFKNSNLLEHTLEQMTHETNHANSLLEKFIDIFMLQ